MTISSLRGIVLPIYKNKMFTHKRFDLSIVEHYTTMTTLQALK